LPETGGIEDEHALRGLHLREPARAADAAAVRCLKRVVATGSEHQQADPRAAVLQRVEDHVCADRLAGDETLLALARPRRITIEGWSIREVSGGTAVLEGPNGVWNATRGDTVPGVGKIDSIVRWGNRWIVATSRGLISTR
jgi:hypothetical protein